MACRGVYFALNEIDTRRLFEAKDDREVIHFLVDEVEQRWEEEWLVMADKAWDAIHRCLTDETLRPKGRSILEKLVLGGQQLHSDFWQLHTFLLIARSAVPEILRVPLCTKKSPLPNVWEGFLENAALYIGPRHPQKR